MTKKSLTKIRWVFNYRSVLQRILSYLLWVNPLLKISKILRCCHFSLRVCNKTHLRHNTIFIYFTVFQRQWLLFWNYCEQSLSLSCMRDVQPLIQNWFKKTTYLGTCTFYPCISSYYKFDIHVLPKILQKIDKLPIKSTNLCTQDWVFYYRLSFCLLLT